MPPKKVPCPTAAAKTKAAASRKKAAAAAAAECYSYYDEYYSSDDAAPPARAKKPAVPRKQTGSKPRIAAPTCDDYDDYDYDSEGEDSAGGGRTLNPIIYMKDSKGNATKQPNWPAMAADCAARPGTRGRLSDVISKWEKYEGSDDDDVVSMTVSPPGNRRIPGSAPRSPKCQAGRAVR